MWRWADREWPGWSSAVEGSVEQDIPSPWRSRGVVRATLFRMWNEAVPLFSGGSVGKVYVQDQEANGLELSAHGPLGVAAAVTASFTWLDTEITRTTHPRGLNVGSSGVQVPRYTGALAVRVTPVPSLDLSMMGTYDDGRRRETIDLVTDALTVVTSKAYTRLNLSADWRLQEWASLRFRVENLLDETDLGYSTQTLSPEGLWTFGQAVGQDPGRVVALGFALRFQP